jgi:hypothetical protein
MTGGPLEGWTQIRVVMTDGRGAMRISIGLFDGNGRPGTISDLVTTDAGQKQEAAGGRIEPDGRIDGTHWLTVGDRHIPRPLDEAERAKLRVLADQLWHYPPSGKQP